MRIPWWGRRRREAELEDEIQSHLKMAARDRVARGENATDAARSVRREFGGVSLVKEVTREMWGWRWLEDLLQDVRYGARMLLKSRAFTAIAILTLALGIGANTAVFSVVNALVLRPLPVEQPGDLAFLQNARYGPGQSFPNYEDLRDRNHAFAGLAGYRIAPMEMETDTGAQRVWGYLATGNYFDVVGVQPVLGRFFTPIEDLHPAAPATALGSHDSERTAPSLARRFDSTGCPTA